MTDRVRVPETGIPGFRSAVEKRVFKGKQVEQAFLHFMPNFWHTYLMIFQSLMAKNLAKSLEQLAFNPFFG